MNSIQQQHYKGQSFEVNSNDSMFFNPSPPQLFPQLPQLMTLHQLELERIRQVQEQAVLDQRRALFHQQSKVLFIHCIKPMILPIPFAFV
jgi:hypothetical protein